MEKTMTIERTTWINAPRERVWKAVTEPDQLAQWFLPPALGAQMKRDDKGKLSVSMGFMDVDVAVLEAIHAPEQVTIRSLPDRLFATTCTLKEENGGTSVTVTMTGVESLSGDAVREQLEPGSSAWEKALENLKAHIEGKAMPFPQGFVAALLGYRRESREKFSIERSVWINASRERVWRAITDPEQIQKWFSPGTTWKSTGLHVGARLFVTNPETGGEMYVQVVEIVDAPHRLVTRSESEPGQPSFATAYTLEEENGGTRLSLTHSGYERMPDAALRHQGIEQNAFGFGMMLQNIKALLEGETLPFPQGF